MIRFIKRNKGPTTEPTPLLPDGWTPVHTPEALLAQPDRQRLLDRIWQYSAVSTDQFDRLYRAPLLRYAHLIQLLPASEYHHHAYAGGLLDHGLELVATALKLRQSHLLPATATPEDQAAQNDAWSAAIAYGALLHDIGKTAVDIEVETLDGAAWHPWQGPLQQAYRFRYVADREYKLHSAATGLVHHHILTPDLLHWLSTYPAPWRCLVFALAGHYDQADVLGEIITQADRISTAQNIGANPAKALQAPVKSLQHHLLIALRHLVKHELKLNQPGAAGWLTTDALWLVSKTVADKLRAYLLAQSIDGVPSSNIALFDELQSHGIVEPFEEGKAIWKATVTQGDWTHSFTLLRVKPTLLWEDEIRPDDFQGTVTLEANDQPSTSSTVTEDPAPLPWTNDPSEVIAPVTEPPMERTALPFLEDLLPAAAAEPNEAEPPTVPTAESLMTFMQWLKAGLSNRALIVNDSKAMVHIVEGCVFLVTPQLFQDFTQVSNGHNAALSSADKTWKTEQKRFEKLRLHRKQADGSNIWTCRVRGPRKTSVLKGYLLTEHTALFDVLPPNNGFLSLVADQDHA